MPTSPTALAREDIALHEHPFRRDRANDMLLLDLERFDMPGRAEALWARHLEEDLYEVCSIPFFTRGLALGDVLRVRRGGEATIDWPVEVTRHSGHATVRLALTAEGFQRHAEVHGALAQSGLPHEWHGGRWLVVSVRDDAERALARSIVEPFGDGVLGFWEVDD